MLSDLEDDYSEFPDEVAGLLWDAFDRMDEAALRAIEHVRAMPPEAFDATDVVGLEPMGRWAFAIRARHDVESFSLALGLVLDDTSLRAYLDPAALLEYAVWNCLRLGASDECFGFSQRFEMANPDDLRVARVRAWAHMRDAPNKAHNHFEEWAKGDPEAMFEVAEDWAMIGDVDRARVWLALAQAAAPAGHAVHIDCRLLAETLLNHEG